MSRTAGSTGRSRSRWTASGNAGLCRSLMVSLLSVRMSYLRFSRHGAKLPGDELLLADAELLAHGLAARRDGDDELEDLVADLAELCCAVGDPAAVEVH